eukprot:4833811-Ditylum_brightwellii.AAC.1
MVELKEEAAPGLRILWHLYLYVMGSSNNTVELSGNSMDEKKVDLVTHATFIAVKTIASSLFGKYELGAHLAVKKGEQQFLKMKGGPMYAP